MGPTWVLSVPDGPHVGPMNLAIRVETHLPQTEIPGPLFLIMMLWCGNAFHFHMSLTFCKALQWRDNERDGVSNHQPHECLLNHLFRRRSKKTSKLRVTGLCAGNSPGTAQMASNTENVSIWWCHHALELFFSWWCYDMVILSMSLIVCKGKPVVASGSSHKGPVMPGFDIFFLMSA